MATTAQALLALYGALDQAVTDTGNTDIEATVERYLPGSTGPNAGWYDELLGFLATATPRTAESPAVPDLSQALTVLQGRGEPRATAESEALTAVQLSRMAYAIGALGHLPGYYPPAQWDAQFGRTLTMAGAPDGDELLALLRREFDDRDDWPRVMRVAAQQGWVDGGVAVVPLCQPKVKWVRGHLCVVLTTEFTSTDASLAELKNVVDPLNWDNCLPFFCWMQQEPTRSDGWSRVLEHVSTTCSITGTPQLVTPLKYWKGPGSGEQLPQPAAWVDYALDDDPAPGENGDGRMVVDEGFIKMSSTVGNAAKRGVRVRTRKVAGFRNLAWVPAAIFSCAMGYGDQGVEMLLGGVAKRPKGGANGWKDWEPSTPVPAQPAPADGSDTTESAVTVAVDMLNECIVDMSEKSAAMATKWATGVAPIAESMTFATELAARLTMDPWRYLERLRAGGLKVAPTTLAFCIPQPSGELELSDFVEVDPDNECERRLSVASPFVLDGTPSYAIPDRSIVFVPGVLRVYATRFRVGVRCPDLQSGTYRGRVRLTTTGTAAARAVEIDVVVDV